jgi:DNA-binding LytR/AlgR family response regulator
LLNLQYHTDMTHTCIIIDDEPESLNKLQTLVEKTGLVTVIAAFTSPAAAIPEILRLRPALVILDMQMPELSGIDTARIIQKNLLCKFIFATAHPDYALKSFDVDVIHYLMKPVSYAAVFEAATRFLRFMGTNTVGKDILPDKETITVSLLQRGEEVEVAINEIAFFKSQRKLVILFYKDSRTMQIRESLKTLDRILPENRFIKAQRSYIINLDGITEENITARNIILPYTNTYIYISSEIRKEIRQMIHLKRS